MGNLRQWIALLVMAAGLALTPAAAHAFAPLECDATGRAVAGTSLFNADKAEHIANRRGVCQYEDLPPIQHIFSLVICRFVQILNIIMNDMYCGIHFYLNGIVKALLTLYLTVYGAQILMGTAQLSTRDSIIRMLKLCFVYVFAADSAWGISFIFRFFMGFIHDANMAVMNVLGGRIAPQNDGLCEYLGLDNDDVMSMYSYMDYLVCHSLVGPASEANTRVQGLMLALALTAAPVTLLFQWWVMTTLKTLVRTIVTFLKAFAGVAFLTTISPVFLGFFLFQSTAYLFENWLRYIIAFSVQIVITLSIVVFWILTIDHFVGFFNQLSDVIYPYTPAKTVGADTVPARGWGICPGKFGTDEDGLPTVVCMAPKHSSPTPDTTGYAPPPATCRNGGHGGAFDANPPECKTDASTTPPTVTCKPPKNPHWYCDAMDVMPPVRIINQGEFLYFVCYHLFTLLLISYCFSVLLEKTSDIARSLSGTSSAPSLVPGFGNNLGNANGFKAPAFAGSDSPIGAATKNLGLDFHKMVSPR
jgi:type IV secretory pathway VirB6-like protein